MVVEVNSGAANMSKLLADMKALRDQAVKDNIIPDKTLDLEGKVQAPPEFSKLFETAINKVNEVQKESGSLKKAYEMGDPSVDITQVMVASQKASVAFEAMKQVRNKLVDAYRDVMNMPI